MSNPNLPSDYFMPSAHGELYQIVAPDGRIVVNFLPRSVAWGFLHTLQHDAPSAVFKFQPVPDNQMGGA